MEKVILSINKAQDRLRIINNQLEFLHSEKRALKSFIEKETDRLKDIASPTSKAYELKKDVKFIEEHGRERTAKEIGRLMGYSERQIQRFLEEKN